MKMLILLSVACIFQAVMLTPNALAGDQYKVRSKHNRFEVFTVCKNGYLIVVTVYTGDTYGGGSISSFQIMEDGKINIAPNNPVKCKSNGSTIRDD